eukprot:g16788.t1
MTRSNTRNKESKAAQTQELAIAKERVVELEADLQVAKAAAENTALGKSESEPNLKEAVDNLELSKAKASQLKAQLKATMQELESVKAQREVLKMRSGAGYPHRSLSESSSSPAPASKYEHESEANHHPATVNITSMRALHIVASAKRRAENIITCKTELQLFYSYNFGSRLFGMKL